MKKIKVLQFPVANARGGITQYALQNWKLINKDHFQFDFATRSKTLDFADELIAQGCKIHYLSCSSEEDEEQFIKEVHKILDEDYDAIHLHTSFWKGFLVEKIAIERGCPVVIVHSHSTMIDILDPIIRNEYIKKHNYYKGIFPLKYATHFCACSKLAASWLFGNQIPAQDVKVLKNAIDVPTYSFSSETRNLYRKKLGINNCFVMGNVGRFVYQKNHEMLIEIFKKIHEQVSNARLILIGDGILESNIRTKVNEYGLEEVVLFLGRRADVPQLLQAMDVFLLPSRFEGLPIVLIEAQAAGLKCFASESITDEVKITHNLELVTDSISEWVEQIIPLAKGYERENLGTLIADKGYDLRRQIKVLEKLYVGADISKDCSNTDSGL